jgi:hypothetical protein
MALIILLGFGLASSLFVSHLTYWWVDRIRSEKPEPDTRFTKDSKYARLFHAQPRRQIRATG